jgi:ankyrin repeat protein
MASQQGHSEVVKLLLGAEGINTNQADNDGATALLIASQKSHSDVVKLLLDASDIKVNQPMTNGTTPLIIASYLGHASCVILLLTDPAINPALLFQERTALQLAQPSASVEAWEFLEDQINMEGRATVVQLLIDAGAQ